MKIVTSILFLIITFPLFSQQRETFDIVTYTSINGWTKIGDGASVTGFAISNNTKGVYCQVAIYKSMQTMGNPQLDFETDWQDLVATPYKVTTKPEAGPVTFLDGWESRSGVSPYNFNGKKSKAVLVTMSGYATRVSMVMLTNTVDYQIEIEKFIESITLTKPKVTTAIHSAASTEKSNSAAATTNNSSVIGTWGVTASDQSSVRAGNGMASTMFREYTFNTDGTYKFISKWFDPLMDQILLGKEDGRYQIQNNSITLTPAKSVLESWSKKEFVKFGQLLKTQNIVLEKVTYRFSKENFYGDEIWTLILQADAITKRDGASNNNTYYYRTVSERTPIIDYPGRE
jgi:hypothetical protein